MLSRVFAILPFALFAVAQNTIIVNECNTGSISCCEQMQDLNQSYEDYFGTYLYNDALQSAGQVGTNCSPYNSDGSSGSGCVAVQQPVCCTGNVFIGGNNYGCNAVTST